MNRRLFLQSVIAVPLVAVGMPRARADLPTIRSNSQRKLLIVSGGQGYEFEFSDEDEALNAAMRFLENPTESNYWRAREAHQVPDRR